MVRISGCYGKGDASSRNGRRVTGILARSCRMLFLGNATNTRQHDTGPRRTITSRTRSVGHARCWCLEECACCSTAKLAMFFECHGREWLGALLSWELLHSLTEERILPPSFGRLRGGCRCRAHQMYAQLQFAIVGRRFDWQKVERRVFALYAPRALAPRVEIRCQKLTIQQIDERLDIESWK